MKLQVQLVNGPDAGRVFPLTEGEPLIIGRGPQSHTKINDPHMSRVHCQLAWKDRNVTLTNECQGSTWVRGNAVTSQQVVAGDEFQAGDCTFRLIDTDALNEQTTRNAGIRNPGSAKGPAQQTTIPGIKELVGQSLANFRLDSILATGSTGVVFKGTDVEKNRPVAVKVLFPERTSNDEEKQRFVRAMKTMLPIRHPNLVRIFHAGKTGPFCWVAMEYIDGENLTKVIERIGIDGMLDWKNVWKVGVDIASALQTAYEHKVIHRNVTPVNIIRRFADKTCILGDLMLAKALEGNLAVDVTVRGQIVGNLAYLPPESTGGDTPIDCRSDIYGLGSTMYALLTGRPPFHANTSAELIRQIREAIPARPRTFQLSIQEQFEDIVMRMLEKRPESRYESPARLLAELERIGKYNGLKIQ
jgi:eukaryotic-like serine/threonine-protein kinase